MSSNSSSEHFAQRRWDLPDEFRAPFEVLAFRVLVFAFGAFVFGDLFLKVVKATVPIHLIDSNVNYADSTISDGSDSRKNLAIDE